MLHRVCFLRSLCVCLLLLLPVVPAAGLDLPAPDSNAFFTSVASTGSTVYAHTGNRLLLLDQSNPASPQFNEVATGLSVFASSGPAPRLSESVFAAGSGIAATAPGFAGGLKITDLNTFVSQEVPSLDASNLFSLAIAPTGHIYAQQVANDFSYSNRIIRIDPNTLNVQTVVDALDPLGFSGGVSFDSAGNLYASTFGNLDFAAGTGTVTFHRIAADQLDEAAPVVELLGVLDGINGGGEMAITSDGTLYFASSVGVGRFNGSNDFDLLFGDLTANPFDLNTVPFTVEKGLLLDEAAGELRFFGRQGAGTSSLITLQVADPAADSAVSVPEPATATLGLIGLGLLLARRRSSSIAAAN